MISRKILFEQSILNFDGILRNATNILGNSTDIFTHTDTVVANLEAVPACPNPQAKKFCRVGGRL